ncbi:ribonuclease HI family protein [Aerococcaceae bacterium DSM 111176]|nr:ribonuclease HI family protein [Aerococcaceae bacterium DSM 111176]
MIQLYVDAAFRPQTHECGIGIIIHYSKEQHVQHKFYMEYLQDNHQAEFVALWMGLKMIGETKLSQEFIQIFSDSQIVVQSIEKSHAKNKVYQGWLTLIQQDLNLSKDYFINLSHEKNNAGVDQVAKQALNKQGKVRELEI